MTVRSNENLISVRILCSFLLLYTAVISIACYLKYATFQYEDFDMAVHTQSLHNMIRGSLDCSILGIPYFGNHMALILGLIAPLYAALPSPLTLLIVQTMVIAAGAVALFIYSQKYLSHPYPGILAAVYLLYPPLAYMNLYEFHPVALATTFLLYAILAYDRNRPRLYALFLLLAMLCQENISLIVVMLGFWALLDRRKPGWIFGPILSGSIWFAVCVFWIMPALNPGIVGFENIYGDFGDSLPEMVSTILRHPIDTLQYSLKGHKALYLLSLLLPLALTPLIAPVYLVPALPALAQRLLSARGSETTILYHYQAELIPFLFAAAIRGIAKLPTTRKTDWQRLCVVCIVAITVLSLDFANLPSALIQISHRAHENRQLTALRQRLTSSIKPDVKTVATFRYISHLADRRDLHSLHHIYTGRYTISDKPYPMPVNIEVALIDADDPLTFGPKGFLKGSSQANIDRFIEANRLKPLLQAAPLLVLARRDSGRSDETE